MPLYYAQGSPDTVLAEDDLRAALAETFAQLGPRSRVALVPPDYSRYASGAGKLACLCCELLGDAVTDVIPAVGTHEPMSAAQLDKMMPSVPRSLIRTHNWRTDVTTIGEVPGDVVAGLTEGIYEQPWPAQLNTRLAAGEHDLIFSLGQVVPHEVIGMANYNKNLFVGVGGVRGINESHYIGAVYGMERVMGVADTPLRRILNYAQDEFCGHLPLLYALTVIGANDAGQPVMRGLYIGDDHECFWQAAALSAKVNVTQLPQRLERVVVYLHPEKFSSTWLGNKAIYRTRMAIADGGELIVLAPGVRTFGEDATIDQLIRKYGYRTTPEVLAAVAENADLQENLSAPAHLIHGSSEGRFRITYCPGKLSRQEVEGVGYEYGDLAEYTARFDPAKLADGLNTDQQGREFYFVRDPALGLWRCQ
ncbi:MAG: DUF2088 domain-containing protein [Planctomycetales bacterium]|nr:DUF2088 domain-containing protein [Planctomycetales bacterium]